MNTAPRHRPLHVAVFTDHYSPDSSGGVERVVYEVYSRLAAEGVRVLILTALSRKLSPFQGGEGMETHVAPLWDISEFVGAQAGFAPSLFHRASIVLDRFEPDVLHANGLHFQSTLAAAVANHSRKWPMVFTSHVAKLDALRQPVRTLTALYEQSVGRYILSRSQKFIAISESVQSHLEDLGIPASHIDYVPNGVDHSRFFPATNRANGSARVPLIMFVGRHITNKGPHVLLEALGILRDQGIHFRSEFLSSGPLRARLEKRTDQLRLRDLVVFRGHVPDVATEMRRAHIIVRPSFSEGMPLSLMEAMASGVSLVVSDVTGNSDLIRDGVNGLTFPPGRPDLLAQQIRRLIESPNLRESLAKQAAATVQEHSWDRCANETRAVLENAISSTSNRTSNLSAR